MHDRHAALGREHRMGFAKCSNQCLVGMSSPATVCLQCFLAATWEDVWEQDHCGVAGLVEHPFALLKLGSNASGANACEFEQQPIIAQSEAC